MFSAILMILMAVTPACTHADNTPIDVCHMRTVVSVDGRLFNVTPLVQL